MANEAYRAVFLARPPHRQDGAQPDNRGRRPGGPVRSTGRRASSAFHRSTSRSCPRTPIGSASGTASTPPIGRDARGDRPGDRAGSRQGAAAGRDAARGGYRSRCHLVGRRVDREAASEPGQIETIADIALYAHGTGELPAGRRGRAGRAGGLPRLNGRQLGRACRRFASIWTRTSSTTLRAPNSVEYGFMPQSVCLISAVQRPVAVIAMTTSNVIGRVLPVEGQVALHGTSRRRRAAAAARGRAEGDALAFLSTSSSIVFSMSTLSSSPSVCIPPRPSRTRSEPPSTVTLDRSRRHVVPHRRRAACQEVTWIVRL